MNAAGARAPRRGRRWAAVVAALAVSLLGQAGAAPLAAADGTTAGTGLPGGRRTYVVAMMDGRPMALSVRLATYEFTTKGTVTERYWAWTQNGISGKGNVRWTKPSSGYRTVGCKYTCPIRTPVGFQKGGKPHVAIGLWSMESASVLAITWSQNYPVERWQLDTRTGMVGARLLSARNGGHGWGVGSNAPAGKGVSLAEAHAAQWITGPFAENSYTTNTRLMTAGLSARDYTLCGRGTCLQAKSTTSSDRRRWYHSYLAGNPAVDGRKVYWNNQTGIVQQLENPGTTCISASGGGHTNALLQALDDNGRFVGFVGVEASLNQRKYGQAVVAAYAMLSPSLLPAIGAA